MAEGSMSAWQATNPLAVRVKSIAGTGAGDHGVQISVLAPAQMTGLIPRRDAQAAAAELLHETLGLRLPAPSALSRFDGGVLLWTGLDQWLLVTQAPFPVDRLDPDLMAVTDQTGARVVLRVSGAHARDTLAKGCLIDLHPRSFAADAVATTTISHLGVIIWRDGDGFILASPRSTAADLWHWLTISAAEFGVSID
jgi:sarcosine oxidase subunit gamma